MPTVKSLTKTVVDKAVPLVRPDGSKAEQTFWDGELHGFGLRVSGSGVKSYILMYRLGGGRRGTLRRFTIGKTGNPWTPKTARVEAERLRGIVAAGGDPAGERQDGRKAETVSELCDLYLEAVDAGEVRTRRGGPKRASTIATDKGRIARHIKPTIGNRRVADLTPDDIKRFLAAVARGDTAGDFGKTKARGRAIVRGGEGTAARTLGLLSGIFAFAVSRGIRTDNPAHGVPHPKDGTRDRFLSADEYKALGKALIAAGKKEGANKWMLGAVAALALTGCRKTEILSLRRDAVDAARQVLTLEETKTGKSVRPVGKAALDVLTDVPVVSDSVYVFPAGRGDGHITGLPKVLAGLLETAGIEGASAHTLRHSFATTANAMGYSEATIGALLGHAGHGITARYTHHIDSVLTAAADKVALEIARQMGIAKGGNVVQMPRKRRAAS